MNKKIIALAVAAAAFGTQASAAELYNNDGTTFAVGGHVTLQLDGNSNSTAGDDFDLDSNSPRVNITGTQDLGNGFTAEAKGEWALNMLDGGENTFTTRLGYIGVSHDKYGNAVAGTQWAPYYDVAGITDMPLAFANDFLYDNHGALGTGRANEMISYRNNIQLNDNLSIFGALGWQDESETGFDSRSQATVGVNFANFMLGYAYSAGDRSVTGTTKEATSHAISAKYGTYGDGLYVAGVYTQNEYMNETFNYNMGSNSGVGVLEDSNAMEFLVAYALSNSLNLSINYEALESNDSGINNGTVYSQSAIQAEYNVTPAFQVYAAYQMDLGSDLTTEENDMWATGARFYF